MKSIGGYFELELNRGKHYHEKAMQLNLGRNAIHYILNTNIYKKIFIPHYTCEVVFNAIKKHKINISYYDVDQNFEPIFDISNIERDTAFLYNNYFGIKDKYIESLSGKEINLIIDNAQSFFSKPLPNTHTFYSPRKFLGVPDGAYLYTDNKDFELEKDISFERCLHLLMRIDLGAESSYELYKKNESRLGNVQLKHMSCLTSQLLRNIEYEKVATARRRNFNFLHSILNKDNQLDFDLLEKSVPLTYPFKVSNANKIREKLTFNKIFTPIYWPEFFNKKKHIYEQIKNIIFIPIDQRYAIKELERIVQLIYNES